MIIPKILGFFFQNNLNVLTMLIGSQYEGFQLVLSIANCYNPIFAGSLRMPPNVNAQLALSMK